MQPKTDEIFSFGTWLRRQRKAHDWTQEQLAHRAGCALGTIRKIETEQRRPSKELTQRFLVIFDIPPNQGDAVFQLARGETSPNSHYQHKSTASDSVEMRFDFPEAVKVPCQQYLLYFAEFLRDVGVKAIAELREEEGQVLFSVTPDDKDEALDNIREALEIYLRLPMNRQSPVVITAETSIEVQKLSAQLSLLQSQFYLANAALQEKELTIRNRDNTIQQQQLLIEQHIASGQLLIEALKEETTKDIAEPVVGDIVKLKKWNWEAIEVDLPELIRRMKEKFRKKQ